MNLIDDANILRAVEKSRESARACVVARVRDMNRAEMARLDQRPARSRLGGLVASSVSVASSEQGPQRARTRAAGRE